MGTHTPTSTARAIAGGHCLCTSWGGAASPRDAPCAVRRCRLAIRPPPRGPCGCQAAAARAIRRGATLSTEDDNRIDADVADGASGAKPSMLTNSAPITMGAPPHRPPGAPYPRRSIPQSTSP